MFKGIHLGTNRKVAIKRILVRAEKDLFPITAQREITILKRMNHKNIVKLIEVVYDESPSPKMDTGDGSANNRNTGHSANGVNPPKLLTGKHFFMILPYMVTDLTGLLHNPRVEFSLGEIKNIMLQLLEGINYIHCSKFLHRDIKTANILIDHKGVLKIADFGLARNYYGCPPNLKYPGGAGSGAKYTSIVVTRWYRAPEIVLGDRYYTTAVDMWGIGCVFAEFFEKKPILQGKTDIDQGHVIFQLMGTPSMDDWGLAYHLPGAELTKTNYKSTLRERFSKHLNGTGLDLLSSLLALDPYKRLTAMSAKNHPFFAEDPVPTSMLKLPSEECHESDIKRYKNEQNQAMSQRPPSAPTGHLSAENSIRSVTGNLAREQSASKMIRPDLLKQPVPSQPVASRYAGNAHPAVNPAHNGFSLPRGPKGAIPSGLNKLPPTPRDVYTPRSSGESRYNAHSKPSSEPYNPGRVYHGQRDTTRHAASNVGRYAHSGEQAGSYRNDYRAHSTTFQPGKRYYGGTSRDPSLNSNASNINNNSNGNSNFARGRNETNQSYSSSSNELVDKNKTPNPHAKFPNPKEPKSKDVADYY